MLNIHGVSTVARTEAKLFTRSWLFRFLMVFTNAVIGFLSWYYFFMGEGGWMIRSIPSSFPYFICLMLAIFESLIVIFGATDSMHRELNYDTSDSLHTRKISNFGYIVGKVIGILIPCAILNAAVLLVAAIMNVVFLEDIPFVLSNYIVYPLLILVPALFFFTSLSFFVAGLVKSRPLALLLLVGYYVLTFLFRNGISAQIFDFIGLHQPLLSSTVIGFGNIGSILLQRALFIFAGLGSLFAAGLVFQRLPQSAQIQRFSRIAVCTCTVIVLLSLTVIVGGVIRGIKLREHIVDLNKEYVNKPRARLTDCDLDIVHDGSRFDVTATLTLENHKDQAMNAIVLSLNPGFNVKSVTTGGTELDFTRNTQIIEIPLSTPLSPGAEKVLTVTYDGTIDNDACYPDIAPKDHASSNRVFVYAIDKRYGFITPDYILLTPESQWYPSSGIPYGLLFPDANERDFTNFSVTIATDNDLTVVSQGSIDRKSDGSYAVTPETLLPGLTLAAGHFEKKAIDIDGIEVAMYYLPGNDYFAPDFPVMEEVRNRWQISKTSHERTTGIDYPFSRFSLVESPIQFISWERPWKTYIETAQPQMAIVPEMGFYIPELDIEVFQSVFTGSNMPPDLVKQLTIERIGNFTSNYFMNDQSQRNSAKERRARQSSLISFDVFKNPAGYHYQPGYSYSAQVFPFLTSFESDRFPAFNTIMEFYSKYGLSEDTSSSSRSNKALLDEELVCMALEEDTFENLLKKETDFDTFNLLFKIKTQALFGSIQTASGQTGFDTFQYEFIAAHAFENVSFEQFAEAVQQKFNVDMTLLFENWYSEIQLPLFEVTNISLTEIVDREYTCYQTTMTITNTEPATGTMWIRTIGDRGFERETRFVTLEGHQSKQVGFVTDIPPTSITINTIISKNLPIMFKQNLGTPRENHGVEPFEGERIVDYAPCMPDPGTIVVDNLDAGFEFICNPADIDDGENNSRYQYGAAPNDFIPSLLDIPPKRWGKAVIKSAYGTQKVAYYTKGGSGDGKVAWHAEIPEDGRYDLEYYIYESSQESSGLTSFSFIGEGGEVVSAREQEQKAMFGDYHLTVTNGTREDEITFMPNQNQPGWQYVSTMDLEAGQTDVCLSNNSEGTLVYADAIRWVKK